MQYTAGNLFLPAPRPRVVTRTHRPSSAAARAAPLTGGAQLTATGRRGHYVTARASRRNVDRPVVPSCRTSQCAAEQRQLAASRAAGNVPGAAIPSHGSRYRVTPSRNAAGKSQLANWLPRDNRRVIACQTSEEKRVFAVNIDLLGTAGYSEADWQISLFVFVQVCTTDVEHTVCLFASWRIVIQKRECSESSIWNFHSLSANLGISAKSLMFKHYSNSITLSD